MNRTLRRIFDAARQEFASNGPAGTTLSTVAARASVAKQLIYYYFRSKGGLHLAVTEENALDTIYKTLSHDYDRLEPRVALKAMIDDMFDQMSETMSNRVGLHECLETQALHASTRNMLRAAMPAVSAKMEAILLRGAADGSFQGDVDADLFLGTALSLMYGCFLNEAVISAATSRDLRTPAARFHWVEHVTRLLLVSINTRAPAHPYVRS